MDRGAWQAAVQGAESQTGLSTAWPHVTKMIIIFVTDTL